MSVRNRQEKHPSSVLQVLILPRGTLYNFHIDNKCLERHKHNNHLIKAESHFNTVLSVR